jgi:hypothetical protein
MEFAGRDKGHANVVTSVEFSPNGTRPLLNRC